MQAFRHERPDRTPLFELYWPYHPVHWEVCGHTVATDMRLAWDAMADGIAWEELVEAEAQCDVAMARHFGLDMMHIKGSPPRNYARPRKSGQETWELGGVGYAWNPRTCLIEPQGIHSGNWEDASRGEEEFTAMVKGPEPESFAVDPAAFARFDRVRELLRQGGDEIVTMAEVGCGTGAAFYPPFMYIWMLETPDLFLRWRDRQKRQGLALTAGYLERGADVVAMGGDTSCDRGPVISPALYREFVLPAIQEHVEQIHAAGALAVYTSDGNHWPIRDLFFYESRIDGYKEVDQAAGMTMERLVREGVKDRVTIVGNIDARHTLCRGTPEDVRRDVRSCLEWGLKTPGGHILHTSHSIHEDVPVANYLALVDEYRRFFGL
jgi:hypothetical protein